MKKPPITDFDSLTINDTTQLSKAILPFIDKDNQKTISIIIRIQELFQTIEYFNNPIHTLSIDETPSDYSFDDIFKAIKDYCNDDLKNIFKTASDFSDIYKTYNLFEQNSDLQSIIQSTNSTNANDMLTSLLLNEDQLSSYNQFMNEINKMNFDTTNNSNQNGG